MALAELLDQYGYAAVFVGSLLEGETILLLAGVAASHGYLSFMGVVALAFVGGTLGDQILFQVGRHGGKALLDRFPRIAARAQPVNLLIARHEIGLIIGVRFMYGLRLIGPIIIGMSEVSTARFAVLNMIGAALWAPLVVGAGYLFGGTLSWLINGLGHYETVALIAFAALAIAGYVLYMRRSKRGETDA